MQKKIYIDKDQFDDNASFYVGKEDEFEQLVKRNIPKILGNPSAKVYSFKLSMISDLGGGVAPDLIMIDSEYNSFWIIEVETDNHSVRTHVIPQIRKLQACRYDFYKEKIFKHLKKVNKKIDIKKDKFLEMIDDIEPGFLVISNRYSHDWDMACAKNQFQFIAMAPYINEFKEDCLYVKHGRLMDNIKTYPAEWYYHYFRVSDIGKDSLLVNTEIMVEFEGKNYRFLVEKFKNGYELHPSGSNPISDKYSLNKLKKINSLKYINKKHIFEV